VAKQHVLHLQQQNQQLTARLALGATVVASGGSGGSAEVAAVRAQLAAVKAAAKENLTTTVKSVRLWKGLDRLLWLELILFHRL